MKKAEVTITLPSRDADILHQVLEAVEQAVKEREFRESPCSNPYSCDIYDLFKLNAASLYQSIRKIRQIAKGM